MADDVLARVLDTAGRHQQNRVHTSRPRDLGPVLRRLLAANPDLASLLASPPPHEVSEEVVAYLGRWIAVIDDWTSSRRSAGDVAAVARLDTADVQHLLDGPSLPDPEVLEAIAAAIDLAASNSPLFDCQRYLGGPVLDAITSERVDVDTLAFATNLSPETIDLALDGDRDIVERHGLAIVDAAGWLLRSEPHLAATTLAARGHRLATFLGVTATRLERLLNASAGASARVVNGAGHRFHRAPAGLEILVRGLEDVCADPEAVALIRGLNGVPERLARLGLRPAFLADMLSLDPQTVLTGPLTTVRQYGPDLLAFVDLMERSENPEVTAQWALAAPARLLELNLPAETLARLSSMPLDQVVAYLDGSRAALWTHWPALGPVLDTLEAYPALLLAVAQLPGVDRRLTAVGRDRDWLCGRLAASGDALAAALHGPLPAVTPLAVRIVDEVAAAERDHLVAHGRAIGLAVLSRLPALDCTLDEMARWSGIANETLRGCGRWSLDEQDEWVPRLVDIVRVIEMHGASRIRDLEAVADTTLKRNSKRVEKLLSLPGVDQAFVGAVLEHRADALVRGAEALAWMAREVVRPRPARPVAPPARLGSNPTVPIATAHIQEMLPLPQAYLDAVLAGRSPLSQTGASELGKLLAAAQDRASLTRLLQRPSMRSGLGAGDARTVDLKFDGLAIRALVARPWDDHREVVVSELPAGWQLPPGLRQPTVAEWNQIQHRLDGWLGDVQFMIVQQYGLTLRARSPDIHTVT